MMNVDPKMTGLMRVICSYCGRKLGVRPCLPQFNNSTTHGVCNDCEPQLRKELGFKTRRRGRRP